MACSKLTTVTPFSTKSRTLTLQYRAAQSGFVQAVNDGPKYSPQVISLAERVKAISLAERVKAKTSSSARKQYGRHRMNGK